ncbi:hypothetical protein ACFFLM_21280 [Deinococcus oregonensis]|uniref:Uncharacterized protein n=1 Tax=Deinococcus oregonensis TaxID=1805970 RepID=A0ABV6B7Y6_9DEIO
MNSSDFALLAALGLAGVLGWREWDKVQNAKRGHAAAGGQLTGQPGAGQPSTGGALNTGALLPVGSTSTPTNLPNLAAVQQAEAERQAAVQRQANIDTLRRDLARIWNDMDVQIVQADSIKRTPVDPAFQRGISDRVWAQCRSSGPFISQAYRCNDGNMPVEVARVTKIEWAERLKLLLQPVQAQLSRLNADQLSTIDNLRALGYSVPQTQQKTGSV